MLTLPTKVHLVKAMVFLVVIHRRGSHAWTPKKKKKKGWALKMLTSRKSSQSVLKEISPKFIGRTDAEAESPILWPPDAKNWLIGKDPDSGKDWRQKEKGMTEDEMVGWHHWLNWHEFESAPGANDRQGSVACCSPWGRKESGMTEQLNWEDNCFTMLYWYLLYNNVNQR